MPLSPRHDQKPAIPVWVAVTAIALLIGGGSLIIWANKADTPAARDVVGDPNHRPVAERPAQLKVHAVMESSVPQNWGDLQGPLHSVNYVEENGTKVVKIRVVAGGDELVIDATTGRLIETRPVRPQAASPTKIHHEMRDSARG